MNPKTKKTAIFALLALAIIVGLTIPSFIHPTNISQMRDLVDAGALSTALLVYEIDRGKFPVKLEEILTTTYVGNPKYFEDLIKRARYIQPPERTAEQKYVMLILPCEDGVTISYSNGNTEFIKTKKRE